MAFPGQAACFPPEGVTLSTEVGRGSRHLDRMARARHLGTNLHPRVVRLQEGQEAMPEQSKATDHGVGFL